MNNNSIPIYVESITHKLIWTKALLFWILANESNDELAEALDGILFILDTIISEAESLFKIA